MADEGEQKVYGKAWEKRFTLLDKCIDTDRWHPNVAKTKELAYGERISIGFNIWGFLFSAIYYYAKGMWAKASLMLATFFLLGTFLEAFGITAKFPVVDVVVSFAMPIFCVAFANIDYYHKVKRNERMWSCFPSVFGEVWFAVAAPLSAVFMYWLAIT